MRLNLVQDLAKACLGRTLANAEVVMFSGSYDPDERAREKQASRERDERDLATGEKTQEQLRHENGHFSSLRVRINYAGAKSLA